MNTSELGRLSQGDVHNLKKLQQMSVDLFEGDYDARACVALKRSSKRSNHSFNNHLKMRPPLPMQNLSVCVQILKTDVPHAPDFHVDDALGGQQLAGKTQRQHQFKSVLKSGGMWCQCRKRKWI